MDLLYMRIKPGFDMANQTMQRNNIHCLICQYRVNKQMDWFAFI